MVKIMILKIFLVTFAMLCAGVNLAGGYSIEELQDKFDDAFSEVADENGIIHGHPYYLEPFLAGLISIYEGKTRDSHGEEKLAKTSKN